MKTSTAILTALGGLYAIYAISSFAFSVKSVDDMDKCQDDIIRAIKAKSQFGSVSTLSDACASMSATGTMVRALTR